MVDQKDAEFGVTPEEGKSQCLNDQAVAGFAAGKSFL